MPNQSTITFASYRVPIYTPGWRVAMRIKCLAKGHKCRAAGLKQEPRDWKARALPIVPQHPYKTILYFVIQFCYSVTVSEREH